MPPMTDRQRENAIARLRNAANAIETKAAEARRAYVEAERAMALAHALAAEVRQHSIDRRDIITTLSEDGVMNNAEIGSHIGLGRGAIWKIIHRPEPTYGRIGSRPTHTRVAVS